MSTSHEGPGVTGAEQTGNTYAYPEELQLHHQALELSTDFQLLSQEDNKRVNGVNAAVLAELTLPTKNESGEDKVVQILDHGKDMPEGGYPMYWLEGVGDLAFKTKSRFTLHSKNFTPKDHMLGFMELPLGKETTVGRDPTNYAGNRLGLADHLNPDLRDPGNRTLSNSHFTVAVSEDARILVADHSTNKTQLKGFPVHGTMVHVPAQQIS